MPQPCDNLITTLQGCGKVATTLKFPYGYRAISATKNSLMLWLGIVQSDYSYSAAVVATIITTQHLVVWHVFQVFGFRMHMYFESSYCNIHSPCFCMAYSYYCMLLNWLIPSMNQLPPTFE